MDFPSKMREKIADLGVESAIFYNKFGRGAALL